MQDDSFEPSASDSNASYNLVEYGSILKEVLDVGAILEDICESDRPVVLKRELCLMQQFDHGARVFTDKAVLKKVCSGLLKNAIENTPDEGWA